MLVEGIFLGLQARQLLFGILDRSFRGEDLNTGLGMISLCCLVVPASFGDRVHRSFDLLLRPIARLEQCLSLVFEGINLQGETRQNRLASQERIVRRNRGSAEDDSIRGDKLAPKCCVLETRTALLEFKSSGEVGHNNHVA